MSIIIMFSRIRLALYFILTNNTYTKTRGAALPQNEVIHFFFGNRVEKLNRDLKPRFT